MTIWSKTLGGLTALLLMAGGATAQDKHVKWHDDDSVDLILDDGTVIKTTRDDLGSLFGPGEKPFDGTEITVLSLDSGPKGGISGPIHSMRPVWEELSGGKLNIALTPITDLYAKMMLDLRQGTGLYDSVIVGGLLLRRPGGRRFHDPDRRLYGQRRVPEMDLRLHAGFPA